MGGFDLSENILFISNSNFNASESKIVSIRRSMPIKMIVRLHKN